MKLRMADSCSTCAHGEWEISGHNWRRKRLKEGRCSKYGWTVHRQNVCDDFVRSEEPNLESQAKHHMKKANSD